MKISSYTPPLPRRELTILFFILLLSFSLRLAFVHEPIDCDEGVYAYIGQEILAGKIPYKDAIDIKPPGVYYIYALAIALGGESTTAIRLFTACYTMLTVLAVFLTARKIAGPKAGLAAALLYGIFSTFLRTQGSGSNSEVFLVLPLTASIYFFCAAERERYRNLLLSGLCSGIAMLIKPVALPEVVVLTLILIAPWRGKTAKGIFKDLASFVSPMILLAAITLWYFYAKGAFADFWYWNVRFPRKYLGRDVMTIPWPMLVPIFSPALTPLVFAGIPAVLCRLFRDRKLGDLVVLLSIAAACIGIYLPHKLFPHYFILVFPPLCIAAGIGLGELLKSREPQAKVALALMLGLLCYPLQQNYKYYFYSPEEASRAKFGSSFLQSEQIARYIRERTSPSDYIFQWGLSIELYFLADRPAPNRFMSSLLVKWSEDPKQATRDMVASLAEKRPVYIYTDGWRNVEGYNELMGVIRKDYVEEVNFPNGTLYRLRPVRQL